MVYCKNVVLVSINNMHKIVVFCIVTLYTVCMHTVDILSFCNIMIDSMRNVLVLKYLILTMAKLLDNYLPHIFLECKSV